MIGSLLDQRYQVVELLGKGGFGHTYTAQDTRRPGNPTCVVKHLKPATHDPDFLQTARRLFSREAEALEKLGNHDQIPRLLAYFEENEEFFLVQEYIDGHPLSVEMLSGNRWEESQVIQLLYEILPVLDFIHNNNVIHRDLKPQNIIRRHSDNKLVLVDFGAVKQVQMYSLMSPEQQFKNQTIIGTPGYMPSEQAQGRPRPNSDIYALGIIAIQAVTGLSPKQLAEDLTSGEIIWRQYAQINDQLADIISKMVRRYYKYRFHFADEALEALASITHPNTPTAIAAAVKHILRNSLREGYVSANKVMQSLHKLAKPSYTPPDNTTIPNATLPPAFPAQSTMKIPLHLPTSPNNSPSSLDFLDKYRRKLPLLIAGGGGIVLVVFSIFSASPPPQQPSAETADKGLPETIEEKTKVTTQDNTTDQNTTQMNIPEEKKEQNNCIVVTRPANLRAISGRRRTGKVIKAGTQVTVTGKQDDGWIEITTPEEGWIWGSRTKNTCKARRSD